MAKLAPIFNDAQFISGIPANGAKLFTYVAGSSTKQTTYTDEAGLTAQSNPIVLNSRGEPAQPIWLTEGLSYKFVFAPSTDSDPPVSPIRTIDNITGINDASLTIDQWVDSGVVPTYINATSFTVQGDQTTAFHAGRRVKVLITAGTAYGTILSSVFGALTTVTVVMDSTPLDSGLSSVQLGLITSNNSSIPYNLSAASIQKQTFISFTTGGTATAFTLTPYPAITANTTNTRFNVILNQAPGASPTLAVSGLVAANLKYYDSLGAKQFIDASVAPSGWQSDVIYDGTDWVMESVLLQPATNADYVTGTDTRKYLNSQVARARNIVAGTYTALTGTAVTVTGVPSWVKEFSVGIVSASTGGTNQLTFQLGDAGGIETTVYVVTASDYTNGTVPNASNITTGFQVGSVAISAAATISGVITFTQVDPATNLWEAVGSFVHGNEVRCRFTCGHKALSAALDRFSISAGGDTFDGGFYNYNWK